MPEITFEDRVTGLRGWPNYDGPHDRAAVELLIWHETWLRRADFVEACVVQRAAGLVARIDWFLAEQFAARVRIASSSERAILELAVMLAEREAHWLKFRGDAHAQAVVTAIAAAMSIDIVKPAGPRVLDGLQHLLIGDASTLLARWDSERSGMPIVTVDAPPSGTWPEILARQVRNLLDIIDHLAPQGEGRG